MDIIEEATATILALAKEIKRLNQQVKTLEAKNKELLALCLNNSFEWSEPYDINYKVTLYGDGGTGKMEETR